MAWPPQLAAHFYWAFDAIVVPKPLTIDFDQLSLSCLPLQWAQTPSHKKGNNGGDQYELSHTMWPCFDNLFPFLIVKYNSVVQWVNMGL